MKMTLGEKQRRFTYLLGKLITWAYENGYEFSVGDAKATTGHVSNSFHYKQLAIDLNLFIDGHYQTTTEAHEPLGAYWRSIGGSWGGDFPRSDGNHYSFGEGE